MKTTYHPELVSKLKDSYLILDANVFFHAINNESFYKLLKDLGKEGCVFLTIQPAIFEFTRGAKSVREVNYFLDFINNLKVVVARDIDKEASKEKAFTLILHKECKKLSYADSLLLLLLHKYAHIEDKVFLMSSNSSDVPTTLFDRTDILALEYKEGVQVQALYKNSAIKLAEKLISTNQETI